MYYIPTTSYSKKYQLYHNMVAAKAVSPIDILVKAGMMRKKDV